MKNIKNSETSIKINLDDVNGIMKIIEVFKDNGAEVTYFISGPPQMIKGFRGKLITYGVSNNRVLTDEWD